MIRRHKLIFITLLLIANILAWITVYDLSQPQLLEVSFFDVGQGDSIFIETPQGHQILIDGGPDSAVLEKLGSEMPFSDRSIDLIVLTHPEHDHIAGLISVLGAYEVENVLWTGIIRETVEYREWLDCLEKEGTNIIIAKKGQRIVLGGVYIDVLYPFESLEGEIVKEVNNSSVVFRLVFGENSFLFTGDIFKSVERELEEADSDILKVSHHGSKTSSDEDFIVSISPDIAVIQVGKDNRYGHPHLETLEILNKYDINIQRTDLLGDIKIISNSINYVID